MSRPKSQCIKGKTRNSAKLTDQRSSVIKCVTTFEALDINLSNDLSWGAPVNYMCENCSMGCITWNSWDAYDSVCAYAGVQSLSVRRHELGKRLFSLGCEIRHLFTWPSFLTTRLRYYFPASTTHRPIANPIPRTRTSKYRSFVHFALAKKIWNQRYK